jgi:hypothetical protein
MKADHGYDTRPEDPKGRPGRKASRPNYTHPHRGSVYANVSPLVITSGVALPWVCMKWDGLGGGGGPKSSPECDCRIQPSMISFRVGGGGGESFFCLPHRTFVGTLPIRWGGISSPK